MKKVFLLTVVVVTFFLSAPSAAQAVASRFTDVTSGATYYTAIEYLRTNGMNQGYRNGEFRPNSVVDRGDLVIMIVHAHKKSPSSGVYRNCFSDVKTQSFSNEVCFAAAAGWLSDYGNTFYPDQNASVDDARRIISKSFGVSASVLPTSYGTTLTRAEVADLIYRAMISGGSYNYPYIYNNTNYASTSPYYPRTYVTDPYSVNVPDGYPKPWVPGTSFNYN